MGVGVARRRRRRADCCRAVRGGQFQLRLPHARQPVGDRGGAIGGKCSESICAHPAKATSPIAKGKRNLFFIF